jgi:glycolate oxidase iron-sulfur subunit
MLSRILRATGLPALASRLLPGLGVLGRLRLALGMLAATSPWRGLRAAPGGPADGTDTPRGSGDDGSGKDGSGDVEGEREAVALLDGCVQAGLFGPVNEATARVLRANGFHVRPAANQGCCGAIHAHGGDLGTARALARANVHAFEASGATWVVVNAAGCGAMMKEYGHLLRGDPDWVERAERMAARVRDVSEMLARRGPAPGAAVEVRVA